MYLIIILAIIAAVILAAFCVICLIVLKENRGDAERQEKHMKVIEDNIHRVGDIISRNSELIESKLAHIKPEEDGDDFDLDFEIDLDDEPKEKPTPVKPVTPAPAVSVPKEKPAQAKPVTPTSDSITEMIRDIKKLEEETPPRKKITYDTGKSGRKYTAEELRNLIG